ncbi:MAG: cell division protein ZapA [Alphaproteobacteria bacterium HGW-Alphaproteobacteria-2]|nr:MAG: cell division protein ZapA [Alphaproteobacteria bacterium HGW-Alphaproteobacteria-2]
MPELEVVIGGRNFRVACQDGEEPYLHAAAGLLDAEARVLAEQVGRLTDSRLLLMAGGAAVLPAGLADGLAELAAQAEAAAEALAEKVARA